MILYLLVTFFDWFIQKRYYNKKEVNHVTVKVLIMAFMCDFLTYFIIGLILLFL